jgi:hypothetical protein
VTFVAPPGCCTLRSAPSAGLRRRIRRREGWGRRPRRFGVDRRSRRRWSGRAGESRQEFRCGSRPHPPRRLRALHRRRGLGMVQDVLSVVALVNQSQPHRRRLVVVAHDREVVGDAQDPRAARDPPSGGFRAACEKMLFGAGRDQGRARTDARQWSVRHRPDTSLSPSFLLLLTHSPDINRRALANDLRRMM